MADLPIVLAPMAGGPSTPQLAAAVSNAGGYGYLAGGYLSPDALRGAIEATHARTGAPFGVNLFVPSPPGDPAEVSAYAKHLAPEAARLGTALGEPRHDDDSYADKLDLVLAAGTHTVSFTFGCPDPHDIARLHSAGANVTVTVTSPGEAVWSYEAGADELIVQGTEAGGHQSSFLADGPNTASVLDLLREIRDTVPLPLVAAGGLMTGRDIVAALNAGARAAQLGTAFLCAKEAGTSPLHQKVLLERRFADTMITRAFSGRYARGLANRFAREHSAFAPTAYPEVHHLTRPLRTAATKAGDPDVPNLWAGTGWTQIRSEPAAQIVRRLAAELKELK